MYVNNIPEATKNSLADFDEIESLYNEFGPPPSYTQNEKKIKMDDKNPFTSKNFKMIKIIERILVTLPSGRKTFFPYELQILTRHNWEKINKGKTHHDQYEARQIAEVKRRLFG